MCDQGTQFRGGWLGQHASETGVTIRRWRGATARDADLTKQTQLASTTPPLGVGLFRSRARRVGKAASGETADRSTAGWRRRLARMPRFATKQTVRYNRLSAHLARFSRRNPLRPYRYRCRFARCKPSILLAASPFLAGISDRCAEKGLQWVEGSVSTRAVKSMAVSARRNRGKSGSLVKVYLLLVNDKQFFFYSDESEIDESREEDPAPPSGLRGWLQTRWHRFEKAFHEADAGVALWARRSWDWLHSLTHPDETMLVRFRATRRIELHHPASRTAEAVARIWQDYLARKWRRHVIFLSSNALIAPPGARASVAVTWPQPDWLLVRLSRDPPLADRPGDPEGPEGTGADPLSRRGRTGPAGPARWRGKGATWGDRGRWPSPG